MKRRRMLRGFIGVQLLFLLVLVACTDAVSTIGFDSSFTSAASPFPVVECDATCSSPGSVTLDLVVTRSGDLSSSASVSVSTRPSSNSNVNSATSGADYTPLTNFVVTFAVSETQRIVPVTIVSDGVYESDEQFEAYLANPSAGATLDTTASTAYVVITDGGDAGIFEFSAASYTFREDASTVQVKIVRGGGTSGNVVVNYALANPMQATAVVNSNFKLTRSVYQASFDEGQTEAYIDIEPVNDDVYEANEYFYLEISSVSSPGKVGLTSTTVVFIADDGDAGQFNFAVPYIFCREDSGNAVVTIVRSGGFSSASYVPVALVVSTVSADSNATQGGSRAFDYLDVSQQLTWATDQVSQTFAVKVFNNNRYQPASRAVKVRLDSVTGGATIGTQSEMWIYIVDDRDAGTLSFASSHYEVLENSGRVTVTISRSGIPDATNINTYTDGVVTVDIATYSGTILPGKSKYDIDYDYGIVQTRGCTHISPCTAAATIAYTPIQTTTLTFANGQASRTVNIAILNNNIFQAPDQVFKVMLRNVAGGAHLGVDYDHPREWNWYHDEFLALEPHPDQLLDNVGSIVTIQDDGDPAVIVTKTSLSVSEIGQVDSFRVRLNSMPASDVNIQLGFDAAELTVSPATLSFSSISWSQYQTVIVSAIPDNSADGIHSSLITITPSSSDASYNSPLRTTVGSSGYTLATGIYTQLWGKYDTGNAQHAFPWKETNGVLTAPAQQPSISAYILDDDQPIVIVAPETVRHQSVGGRPQNFVDVRENGHEASVRIALSSEPHGDVEVSFVVEADSNLQVEPNVLHFSSSNWQVNQSITVSAVTTSTESNEVQFSRISLYSTSSIDTGYNKAGEVIGVLYVRRLPAATVLLDSSLAITRENGGSEATTAYNLSLGSEPMHWEPGGGSYKPFQLTLQPNADTTLVFSANAQGSLGTAGTISAASNSSQSTSDTLVKYVAAIRFDINPAVQASTDSSQVGLAILRLYRLSGGENGGLGGIVVGVTAAETGTSDGWNETLLSTACTQLAPNNNTLECSLVENGTVVPTLFPVGTTFNSVNAVGDGETLITQSREINPSTNQFVPSSGWIEIDVTAAVNRVLAQLQDYTSSDTSISFLVYSRSVATFVYNGTDEVVFASRENINSIWRPQLKLTASGSVNLALSGTASQSQQGNAGAAIDGNTGSNSGIASSYAMSRSVDTYPWWEVDLRSVRRIEDVVISVTTKIPSGDLQGDQLKAVFWVFLAKVAFPQSTNDTADFLVARSSALYSRQFELTSRSFGATEDDITTFRWRVNGEAKGYFGDDRFIANYSIPTEARFLRLQVEGENSVLLNEVEVYQQAFASSKIAVGGYMPSIAAHQAKQNQIEFSMSYMQGADASPCNKTTRICRHELLFTSGNWQTPQQVQVSVIDDKVAMGDRKIMLTHTSQSLDGDYAGSSLCEVSVACNSQLFNDSSIKTLLILEDDENKVILSKSEFNLTEGSHAYPTASPFYRTAEVHARYFRCSNDPTTIIDLDKMPDSACMAAFSRKAGIIWEPCITNSSAQPLESGSAWMMAGFESPTNVSSILLVLAALTDTKYIRQLTLWGNPDRLVTDSVENVVDIKKGWAKMALSQVSMKSGGPQTITLEGLSLFMVRSILIVFDESYDTETRCIRAPQVTITGYEAIPFPIQVRGDLTDPDSVPLAKSHLSRMHLYGEPDKVQLRLSSEPLADTLVSVLVEAESADVVVFDATNASSASETLSDLVGAYYEPGDIRQYRMPTALRFTAENWDVAQELTFLAVDDNTYLGNRAFVMHVSSLSNDLEGLDVPVQSMASDTISRSFVHLSGSLSYSTAEFVVRDHQDSMWPYHIVTKWRSAVGAINVSVVDDDLPGVTISSSEVVVSESSLEANFSVSLDSAPLQDVSVAISYEKDPSLFSVSPVQLTFTRSNWFLPQWIGIYPSPNDAYDGGSPYTLNYERLIPKAKQPVLSHRVMSSDGKYNALEVGTNENDSSIAYFVNQGVRVVIEDDDTGCAKEYSCLNGGKCVDNSWGNVCWCPTTFGMKNCSAVCQRASQCAFDRMQFRVKCLRDNSLAICTSEFSAKGLTAVLYRMLTVNDFTGLDGKFYPKLSLSPISEAMYVVNSTEATCVDGSAGCVSVAVDFLRPSLDDRSVPKKLVAYQKAGSLKAAPMFIELMTSDPQYEDSLSAMIAMWIFVGFCGLALTGAGVLFTARAVHAKSSHVSPQEDLGENAELLAPGATSPRDAAAPTSPVST